MKNKTENKTENETENHYNLRNLYLDFKEFKIDIKTELKEHFKQLTSLCIGIMTVTFLVFVYVFDNRLDDTKDRLDDTKDRLDDIKEYHQERMAKIEDVLFSLASDDFTETIKKKRKSDTKKKRKKKTK